MIPVRFADAKEFLVEYTSNISLGGVFVRTASPAPFGTVVRLSLELPGTSQAVPVTGQVAFVLPPDQAARQGKVPGMGVRFARLDQAVQETLAAYVETLQRKSKGRVLLVDDDAVITQKLADLLREHHLNVTTVSNAIKALEILRFGGVDFVISDINMPRMDGFEFRDNLRNNPKTATIPFVFLTASDNPADVQLAAELGVHYFLRKPVEPGPLLALLKQVLGEGAFQPDAPGAAPPPTEEKLQRKKVQDRRIVEIAYRKFVALGLDTRFTADERGVFGQLTLKHVNIQDPATGQRLERAGLYSVGHDRAKPFWPRLLGSLPMFPILDIPDGPALERQIAAAFMRRIELVKQVKGFLDRFKIPNRYDAGGMRMLGQVKSGTDQIVFSVRDPKTVFLETLNGRSFGEVAAMRARLVDVSDAKSGVDVEIALETACRRLQQSMATPKPGASGVSAIGADGRRMQVEAQDLSAADDAADAPARPDAAPQPQPAPQKASGEWIGEPEGEPEVTDPQALAQAAIDMATKAAIAATVAASSAPPEPPLEEAAPVEAVAAPASSPFEEVWPAESAAPAAAERLVVAEASPEQPSQPGDASPPPPVEEVPVAQDEPAPAMAAESEPAAAAEPGAETLDDWSAYATPDANAGAADDAASNGNGRGDGDLGGTQPEPEAQPGEVQPETVPAVEREPLAADGGAFRGEEFELAASGGGSDLELAAPEAASAAEAEPAWSARDAEPPPDMSEPVPDVEVAAPSAEPVPVATSFDGVTDLESTMVPRTEPDEPLSPEEAEARKWADEWTGDEAQAEPLWTIQPGEEQITAPAAVTSALAPESPAPQPAAPAPSGSAADTGAPGEGMTAMVCTLCGSTYYIGDEIADERLLLVCQNCIAKSPE